jgi:hypothetical protein
VFCRDMLDTDLHDDEARPITWHQRMYKWGWLINQMIRVV